MDGRSGQTIARGAIGLIAVLVLSIGSARGQGSGVVDPAAMQRMVQQALDTGPRGSLAVRALQGTAGGSPMAGDAVVVQLFHRNQVFQQLEATLDDLGVVMLSDLPVAMGIRAVIQITHGGVQYQEIGPPMDGAQPNASVDVTVYDVTGEEPEWRVALRHVKAASTEGSVRVAESLMVDNPSDRTWLGGEPNPKGNRTTVRVDLPVGARNVQLVAGFHGWCCTEYAERTLAVQMPLMPGKTSYRYAYEVPQQSGGVDLSVAAPTPTDRVAFFAPASEPPPEPLGVVAAGTVPSDTGLIRVFEGTDIAASSDVGFRMAGGVVVASAPAPTLAPEGVGSKAMGMGIVAVLAVIGLAAMLIVRGRGRAAAD